MKRVQVLGAGCPRCRKLAENAQAAVAALGAEYRVEKVTEHRRNPEVRRDDDARAGRGRRGQSRRPRAGRRGDQEAAGMSGTMSRIGKVSHRCGARGRGGRRARGEAPAAGRRARARRYFPRRGCRG